MNRAAVHAALDALLDAIQAPTNTAEPDRLDAFPFGLERAAASRLIEDGKLVAVKIGRKTYAKRSDVLALVDRLPKVVREKRTKDSSSEEEEIDRRVARLRAVR